MKKILILGLFFFVSTLALGNAGILQTYIVLDIDGGGDVFYAGGLNPDGGTAYNGQTFSPSTSAILSGGEEKTFRNGTSDVTGATLFYHFYKSGAAMGSFIGINLPHDSDLGGGNQKWQELNADINLVALAIASGNGAGNYVLEIYWQMLHNGQETIDPEFDSNFSNNFTATFFMSSSLLPIELSLFKAETSGLNSKLSWHTASEQNNSHFNIEKSTNTRTWQSIGTIQGHGTTLQEQQYSFIDKSPFKGINYYRLKQVDFDGRSEYSKIVSVDFSNNNGVSIYPNPVRDRLYLLSKSKEEGLIGINIYNIHGRLIKSESITSGKAIDVNALRPGMYLIEIKNDNGGNILMERFVKK